jgi:S-DNA-T family DNA segregation ATPase FtsK/SpoIIIE
MRRRRGHYPRRRVGHRQQVPLLLVADDEYTFVHAVEAVSRIVFRYRSELAPIGVAGIVFAAGWWLHASHPGAAAPIAAATAAACAAVSVLATRTRLKWRGWLGRRSERVYVAVMTAIGGSWLSAATAFGPTAGKLPTLAFVATFIGAVPWWTHHRRRARVRVERTLEAWPGVAETVGLAGSTIRSAVVDAWGFTARVALPRGQTVSAAIDRIPAIESGLATRPGAVRIEPDQTRADWLIMRVIERDPHAEPVPFPGRLIEFIRQPIRLGLFEDGPVAEVKLAHRHVLVGGIVGSGKSGVLNIVLANLTACLDAHILGIDLKGGMELGPWAECLTRLATTAGEALELLRDAVTELDRRAGDLARRGERLWVPVPGAPALVVVVDEYAELGEDAKEFADSIARRGRAVAVTLVVATQRPTQKAMGHSAVRAQMDVRVCLRVRERRDVDLILGQGMHATGWFAHTLDAPGKFLLSSPEHTVSKRARAYHITDEDVAVTARANTARRSASMTEAPFVPKPRTPTEGNTGKGANDPDTALWVVLRTAPENGATVAELMAAVGMSRRWVYYRLQQHADSGRAVQTTRGRWRAHPTTRDRQ